MALDWEERKDMTKIAFDALLLSRSAASPNLV